MKRRLYLKVEKRRHDRVGRLMREGDSVSVEHHKRKYRVYRDGAEYVVMEGGTHVQNPHPAVLRKAKQLLDRAAILDVMDS